MNKKLKRNCDSILREAFGVAFGGRQRYAWMKTTELTVPTPHGMVERRVDGSPLVVMEMQYELKPQVDGPERWVVARLMDPPSEAKWYEAFGVHFPYPSRGYYVATEFAVKVGMEPTEELTRFIVSKLRENESLTLSQHEENFKSRIEHREKSLDNHRSDFIADAVPAFGNIPGQKNHVSFGGI